MTPVILSGGSGSRLWPLSRKRYPKQFLALAGDQTMFQQTLQRLAHEDLGKPVILCKQTHRFIVSEQLAAIDCHARTILLEPFGRNTAPAVAIAAMHLLAEGRDELLLVLPADHVIEHLGTFHHALRVARQAAEQGELVLFGVPAERPETGYGYIKAGDRCEQLPAGVLVVERFVEKPDLSTANEFVASGDYFWNSGMFVFRCSRYLEELKRHAPAIYDSCQLALSRSETDLQFIRIDANTFARCPDISIDYAVMEKAARICVVPLSAGWNDVGSWSAIWAMQAKDANGNSRTGDVIVHDSRNCLVHSAHRLVTLVGLDDVAVVETKDGVMVARKDRVQEVEHLANALSSQGRPEADSHCKVYRPWGSYDCLDNGHRFQVKRIMVKPGASLSLQKHHHRAEHWIVVTGTAKVTCDDKSFLLSENQSTHIPIASLHRLANPGKIPLEIIEVQSGSYLGEDDIERFDDLYGRTDATLDNRSSASMPHGDAEQLQKRD